jgi:hypothetical protein
MKTFDSFPYMLNEIFSEFNDASAIRISYCMLPGEKGEQPGIRLTGVNGFKSVTTFAAWLFSIRANLLGRVMETLAGLEPHAKRQFLHQAVIRCRRLASVANPWSPDRYDIAGIENTDGFFRHPGFDPGQGPAPDEVTQQALIRLTRRYALLFTSVVEELTEGLKCLYHLVEFLPVLMNPAPSKPERDKIPLRVSVQVLGAAARLFYESHEIALDNKAQFCRLVANTFSTTRQRDISFGSLKNHFDCLTPETLDRTCEVFRKMLQNSRKLKKYPI